MQRWYAHTTESSDSETWQPLECHLRNVAVQAETFAASFGYGRWGYALGLLHDIGKATLQFQKRLRGSSEPVDHATAGAALACERYGTGGGIEGMLLAYALAGHHGGVPNGIVQEAGERTPLTERLDKRCVRGTSLSQLLQELTGMGLELPKYDDLEPLNLVGRLAAARKRGCDQRSAEKQVVFSLSVLCRMLYSCLVDADYLDTEQFMTPETAGIRRARSFDTVETLSRLLDAHMERLMALAPDTPVNRARASILRDCRAASLRSRGIFTLSTPTGGGKTLSVMGFAMPHALRHGCPRIIYASPFTSITSQTAEVFRNIFGDANVIEHHSNFDFERLGDERGRQYRLAIQNWDAPIVVTTNVQLLESLYSNKPGACRKLHNIANSVIVLDEAQTLPDGLLTATLAMLEELVVDYGVSVVLCTATQPALENRWPFCSRPQEIVRHREGFDEVFGRRTRFEYVRGVTEEELADDLAAKHQVLCIVGTKAKARGLYEAVRCRLLEDSELGNAMPAQGIYHLSANMTPLHRSKLLEEIRARLSNDNRCVVVSTQLIEAGVDVDFPCVYRELAGLDSLFQAAGRCNREGRRSEGVVKVFELEDDPVRVGGSDERKTAPLARTWLERMKGIARMLIEDRGGVIDESLIKPFFSERYGFEPELLDEREIYRELTTVQLVHSEYKTLRFETVAQRYKIIDDTAKTVFVPWGETGLALLNRLVRCVEAGTAPASMAATLQRSSISVRTDVYDALVRGGVIDAKSFEPISVLRIASGCSAFYSDEVGLLEPGEEEQKELIF